MTENNYSAIELEETTRFFAKSPEANTSRSPRKTYKKFKTSDDEETDVESTSPLLQRFSSFQSVLRPNLRRFRSSFRKLNCFKNNEEKAFPMMEVPRHKSVDVGVGFARRMSLFIFTRRTVCVHPYHPYTPKQTTRKLYFCFDDKHVKKKFKNKLP